MSNRIIIHAPNIHSGGGAVLLSALLKAIPDGLNVCLQVDARFELDPSFKIKKTIPVKPNLISRFIAEKRLSSLAKQSDVVLCFGNLPPLFKNCGKVIVYFHNRFLITQDSLKGFSLKAQLRLRAERFWLKKRYTCVDQFVVQTPTMERLLRDCFQTISVKALPFTDGLFDQKENVPNKSTQRHEKKYDFLYIASGDPHKNHRRLIEAWCLLAEENLYPSLCLTIPTDEYSSLWEWISQKKQQYQLKIDNYATMDRAALMKLYQTSSALIYPSLFESFGLPLIEARDGGIPILAGELDYVRDIVEPIEAFDPFSPVSIKRAVQRFMGKAESMTEILTPESFLKFLISRHPPASFLRHPAA